MRLLALDTSTEWCSVAAGDGISWFQQNVRAGQTHSERLLPMVRAVLAEAGWTVAGLDGVAFGAGPGSFTGIRIACGVAQGLAFAADLPVVPVPTLEAIAVADGHARVVSCLDARMREIYVAAYQREGSGWRCVMEAAVLRPGDLESLEGNGWYGAGDGFAAYPDLARRLGLAGANATIVSTAMTIASIALPRLAAGKGLPAREVAPLYVRHRVALTAAQRAAGERL